MNDGLPPLRRVLFHFLFAEMIDGPHTISLASDPCRESCAQTLLLFSLLTTELSGQAQGTDITCASLMNCLCCSFALMGSIIALGLGCCIGSRIDLAIFIIRQSCSNKGSVPPLCWQQWQIGVGHSGRSGAFAEKTHCSLAGKFALAKTVTLSVLRFASKSFAIKQIKPA